MALRKLTSSSLSALSAHCRILIAVSSNHAKTRGLKMDDNVNCDESLGISQCSFLNTYIPKATPMPWSFLAF
jgi:hypothetical protein